MSNLPGFTDFASTGHFCSESVAIRKYSKQLDSMLRGLGPGLDRALLESAFAVALDLGGRGERDFTREEGVSYNPRPARVVYILIINCGNSKQEVLAAAMLASVCEAEIDTTALPLRKEVQELVRQAQLPIEQLQSEHNDVKQIAIAVRLDRARHYHLAKPNQEQLRSFISDTKKYIPLAEQAAPRVSTLLQAWINRAASQGNT